MIKFFRHIRQRLLKEGKLTRYLAYAIGEIILVVIGILIALQVNDWNDGQKRVMQERKMLNELLMNLRLDTSEHAWNLDFYKTLVNSSQFVRVGLEERHPWNDSMRVHYGHLLSHGQASFNTSAYESLKSMGIDLIRNDSIRMNLTKLHSQEHNSVIQVERELAADNLINVIAPVVTKRIRQNKDWYDSTPRNYKALMDDLEFIGVIRFKESSLKLVYHQYLTSMESTNELISMIEQELALHEEQ
jgi:hypothetical protein